MYNDSIKNIISEMENNYNNGSVQLSEYVDYDLKKTVNTIYAYKNSVHISGGTDSQGREKPFFNICTAAENIWYRATDLDRKDINIKPKRNQDVVKAFVLNILLQEYMRKNNFGTFLNTWGRSLASFGSSVVKFTKSNGELNQEVIPWNRIICDPIDFESNPVIEKISVSKGTLKRNKSYSQEEVSVLLEELSTNKDAQGNKTNSIELYEIHGDMSLYFLTDDENDKDTYVQQMHVVSIVKVKDEDDKIFTLYRGKEKNPYVLTHLIKQEGQTLSIGAVQNLFEAQWMVNHSQKAIKDQLDVASKLVFQTSDPSFIGRNVLDNLQNGDVFITKPNQPVTQMQNNSHDITSLQNFNNQWQVLGKEINSATDAIAGNTMPGGTAWRQVEALRQESHSLFELMIENKGLHLEDMLRIHIIPHLMTKMDTTEELSVILDEQGIKKLDAMYIPNKALQMANQKALEDILDGKIVTAESNEEDIEANKNEMLAEFSKNGGQRFIKPSSIPSRTWKEEMKGFEWDVEVEITGESSNKEVTMTTLTTVMQTLASNPAVLQDGNMKLLFNKILLATGEVTPLELNQEEQKPQAQELAPQET